MVSRLEVATKEQCGEKDINKSKVIPLIHCLIKKCETIIILDPISLQLKSLLLDNLERQSGKVEKIPILSIATILDPRFKTFHSNK